MTRDLLVLVALVGRALSAVLNEEQWMMGCRVCVLLLLPLHLAQLAWQVVHT
jgi:hypothetical protein